MNRELAGHVVDQLSPGSGLLATIADVDGGRWQRSCLRSGSAAPWRQNNLTAPSPRVDARCPLVGNTSITVCRAGRRSWPSSCSSSRSRDMRRASAMPHCFRGVQRGIRPNTSPHIVLHVQRGLVIRGPRSTYSARSSRRACLTRPKTSWFSRWFSRWYGRDGDGRILARKSRPLVAGARTHCLHHARGAGRRNLLPERGRR
jgi:hypothetical protein